jgi:hypothetical protein
MDQRGGSSVRGGLSRGGFSKRGASFRGGAHSTGNFRGARRGRGGSTSSYGVPESILGELRCKFDYIVLSDDLYIVYFFFFRNWTGYACL